MGATALVTLLVYVLIIACVLGLIWYLLNILPIPEPFRNWIRIAMTVVVVIFIIFWLLSLVGGGGPIHIGTIR